MMLSRRSFLVEASTGAALLLACRGAPTESRSNVVRIEVEIPHFIFFPESRRVPSGVPKSRKESHVQTVQMELVADDTSTQAHSHVRVHFSNARVIAFRSDNSFAALTALTRGRAGRRAVMVKSLISWTFAKLYVSTREHKGREAHNELLKDFSRLQEQDVLESVTMGALLQLLFDVEQRRSLTRLTWIRERAHFQVDS
jgi:hypothetical protein